MSNRYYQSENCAETINKEFSMAETFSPNKSNNATNSISFENDHFKFENELLDYPMRDIGEKCGEIFILNCSGDVVYSCQFCEDLFINIGKLIHHCYDIHGFKDNRPRETLNEVLKKNRIDTLFETQNEFHIERQEIGGDTSNQNVNEIVNDNSNQISNEPTQVDLQTSNLNKLIQTPSVQKYILVSTPVINNNFVNQQPQPQMHFQQSTQQTFGIVSPQFGNSFAQIPQNQNYVYNSPIHSGVQTTFVNTPPHNVSNNIGAGASSERVPEENAQMSNFDNLIEFDSGSNSNQSPSTALHKDVGNTIEEIVANYPDDDNILPPTTTEQYVISSEETSNQCTQTFQDHESGNSDIISGNKIEALIEELVNSNSNSQQNYVSENDNNQTPIVLSGNHPQTLYVQNPSFFSTNVQNNNDTNLVNQHIITHQGQPVLLNNEGVQQNYIFDGQHLQPTNFVNASNTQNQTSNLYIKFNESDGNIYLLNGFNNNLNINGIIDSNNQIQISTQNDTVNETVITDEVNITEEEVLDSRKNITENNNGSISCEPLIHNFLNSSTSSRNDTQNLINSKLSSNLDEQMVTTENNVEINNIHMQHVSAEEIVAGPSSHIHEQQTNVIQSDNDIRIHTEEQSPGPIMQINNDINMMDTTESDSPVLNSHRQNIHKNQNNKATKDSFSIKKNNEPNSKTKFLDNFQKFLENKREEEFVVEGTEVEKVEEEIDDRVQNNLKAVTEEHNNSKNCSCKICGRTFREEYHLKLHNNRAPPSKCEHCNLLFCSIKLFRKHAKSHDQTPVIKCDLCSLTFRSQHFLEMHMKNHNDVRPFKCVICKSTFRFQRYLDLHMNRHLGKKPYACNFCEKCFFTGTERSQHELYHIGKGSTFKCKHCNKEFSQRSNLSNHLKIHNNGKTSTTSTSTGSTKISITSSSPSSIKNSTIECEICRMNFVSIELLKEHQNNHTIEANTANSGKVENYNQNNDLIIFSNNNVNINNSPSSKNNCNNNNNNSNRLNLDQISTANNSNNNNSNNNSCNNNNNNIIINMNNNNQNNIDSNNIHNNNNNSNNNSNNNDNNDKDNSNVNINNNNNNNNNNNSSNNDNNSNNIDRILINCNNVEITTTAATTTATGIITTSSSTTYLNCQYCENKFLNNILLNEHLTYCHSNVINNTNNTSNNKCRKCNLILRNSNELSNHLNRCCCPEEEIDVVL